MKIKIQTSQLTDALTTICNAFGTECLLDCEEASLQIPAKHGEGTIKGINFGNGLGLFLLNFTLKKKLDLFYNINIPYPLRAIFCQSGHFTYTFENHEHQYEMHALRSSIMASSDHKNQTLSFPAKTHISLSILEINRQEYITKIDCDLKSIPKQLAEVFRDTSAEDPFLYQGDYSLAIAEAVKTIHANQDSGLVRKTFLESRALELFSLVMRQYQDDLNPNVKKVIIRKVDLDKIETARELLTLDLAKNITIPELARKVGLNENKLKRGFKQAYDTTVNKYLINKRMEYARVLLMSGSFNILEVAEKVGYRNMSFFSRKFKERYGMLPKDFVKNNKAALSA